MQGYVPLGVFKTVNYTYRHYIIQKLGVKIFLSGRNGVYNFANRFIPANFHTVFKYFRQSRQKFRRNILMHKANFSRVANRRAGGFSVVHYFKRLFNICRFINVNVANSRSRFNAGHGSVFNAGFNKPLAAARNKQVYIPLRRHKLVCAGARGVFNQVYIILGKSGGYKSFFKRRNYCAGAAVCLFAAAQYANIARFKTECRRVGRNVRAALVNYSHHAHRHRYFFNIQPVSPLNILKHPAHGVGQLRHCAHTVRHGGNSRFVKP